MTKSQQRLIDGYVEKHHIIPKCLGGSDEKENIAILTPEEHFVAHLLLMKMYPEEPKLALAVRAMCNGNTKTKRKNKLYGWARKKCNEASSKMPRKPRKKETKPRKPRIISEEHKLKISLAGKGRTVSEETRKKMGEIHKNKTVSEETKQKMKEAWVERKKSYISTPEEKTAFAERMKKAREQKWGA